MFISLTTFQYSFLLFHIFLYSEVTTAIHSTFFVQYARTISSTGFSKKKNYISMLYSKAFLLPKGATYARIYITTASSKQPNSSKQRQTTMLLFSMQQQRQQSQASSSAKVKCTTLNNKECCYQHVLNIKKPHMPKMKRTKFEKQYCRERRLM